MRLTKGFRSLCRDLGIGPDRAVTMRCIPFVADHAWRVARDGAGPIGVGGVDAIVRRVLNEAGARPTDPDGIARFARVVAETVRSEVERALAMKTIPVDDAGYLLQNRILTHSSEGYDRKDADQYICERGYTERSVGYLRSYMQKIDPRRPVPCG